VVQGATIAPDYVMRTVIAIRERLNRHQPCRDCGGGYASHPPFCHRCATAWPCAEVRADLVVLGVDPERED
jgi:hypothetical protein